MRDYTTTEVAKLCGVSIRTVCNWTDNGGLKFFRIPGSQHRRIPHNYLVEFLAKENYPSGSLVIDPAIDILLVTRNEQLVNGFTDTFSNSSSMKIDFARNSFDVAIYVSERLPTVIIFDFVIGDSLVAGILEKLLQRTNTRGIYFVAIVGNGSEMNLTRPKFVDTFIRPFDVALLFARLKTIVGIIK